MRQVALDMLVLRSERILQKASPVQSDVSAGYKFVPGQMRPDDMSRPHQSMTFPTTPAQEQVIRRSMESHSQDDYNFFLHNCLQWARERMKDGGVVTTPPLAPVPNAFMETQRRWTK